MPYTPATNHRQMPLTGNRQEKTKNKRKQKKDNDMKKVIKSMLAVMIAAFAFASCSDVPSPYSLFVNDDSELEGAAGSGTLEDPFNVPGVLNYIKTLDAGAQSDVIYIKGIVSTTVDGQNYDAGFGNGTYYISIDGEARNQFYIYRALYLENQSYVDGPTVNVGDEVIICGKVTTHGTTPETVEKEAYLYSINGVTQYEAKVFGSAEAPLSVSEALTIINGLENNETIGNGYVKGIVVKTDQFTASSGKLSYYISADGQDANTIQVFKGLGLEKAKFTAATDLAAGDEVVVFGPLTKYANSSKIQPEINDGNYLISLTKGEGGGGETIEPSGNGTQQSPYNVAGARNAVKDLTWTSTTEYQSTGDLYIQGTISRIANKGTFTEGGTYGNASFYISDNGKAANEFYCYRILYLNNTKYNEYDGEKVDIKVGDKVIVCGKLMNYQSTTPETVAEAAYLYALNPEEQEGGSDLLTNGGFEAWDSDTQPTGWLSESPASSSNLSKSTDAHGGSYSVKITKGGTANKRLASKEISLTAGTYTMTAWAKSTTTDPSQAKLGYVTATKNGDTYNMGSYTYQTSYVNLNSSTWTQLTYEFTLSADATVCLLVLNPKNNSTYVTSQDILVDDMTITKK